MVKCVVSSCSNREQLGADRGCSRAPKRFFSFPKDPARVKVWLAALREPDKRDNAENHVICEDHFLPEDVSDSGVSPDAIPIMPPCLEEELGLDAWPEDPEEDGGWAMADEDQEEEEEEDIEDEAPEEEVDEDEVNEDVAEEEDDEQINEDEEVDDEEVDDDNKAEELDDTQMVTEGSAEAADGDTAPPADGRTELSADAQTSPLAVGDAAPPADEVTVPPADEVTAPPADEVTAPPADEVTAPPADEATAPPAVEATEPAVTLKSSPAPAQPPPPSSLSSLSSPSKWESKKLLREDVSLTKLARSFLELLLNADGSVDVREAARTLQSPKRRLYEVTNILMGIDLLRKESANRVRWTGKCPISSFLWGKQKLQQEAEKLKRVEDALDGLIKSCAQQLFSMTDDRDNANAAFVTFADVRNLPAFQDQTVIVVKAPEETKLEVPTPKEDSIQVHLKSGSGPISVLTCDSWLDVSGKILQTFRQIQHSHIQTRPLQTESSSSLSV